MEYPEYPRGAEPILYPEYPRGVEPIQYPEYPRGLEPIQYPEYPRGVEPVQAPAAACAVRAVGREHVARGADGARRYFGRSYFGRRYFGRRSIGRRSFGAAWCNAHQTAVDALTARDAGMRSPVSTLVRTPVSTM
jgi:hypothetical protein